jgi:hypothetical protein
MTKRNSAIQIEGATIPDVVRNLNRWFGANPGAEIHAALIREHSSALSGGIVSFVSVVIVTQEKEGKDGKDEPGKTCPVVGSG